MNEVHGETFALAHRGIGRISPARVLTQRLATFTPQSVRGADPWLSARSGGASMNELDLAGLNPQAPDEEEGAAMPLTSMARDAVAETATTARPEERPSSVASQTSLPPDRVGVVASVPEVRQLRGETMQAFSPPRHVADAPDEVFALAIPASAPPPVTTPAPRWGLAEPTASLVAPDVRLRESTAQPVPPTRSQSIASAAPQPAAAIAHRDERVPPAPIDSASPMGPARRAQPDVPVTAAPTHAQSDLAPLRPKQVSKEPAAPPAQPMGHIEAPAGATRLPPATLEHRVLERLAEAARKPADEAVIRIGSVSVVMRPAPSAPPPQQTAPAAPPTSAPMRSAHRNPWLSRGRGGE